ncbi:Predicted oxidoreductase [Dethiosulfovibrio salsuginis]|uniref:Predicted oxidoreductase n=2 Tax=Dethiosulfovibrio salsuginis TaxID=561720 RepID=A0A1X7ICR7_9BACT|nr:Predicted oxidoreductase [Dethiosulfovibrio salsuginis]
MEKMMLGKTGLEVTRTSFGALPIQRIPLKDAAYLLRKAYDCGINYFDTARAYSDSEEKIGAGLGDVRERIVISTKSHSSTPQELREHVETSLSKMKTNYVDILQFHNPKKVFLPGGDDGMYDELLRLKDEGKVRFIGYTNHSLARAKEAAKSGFYDTVQFPLNHLSSQGDMDLARLCEDLGVGFIAMKGMSGGLITDARLPFAFLRQFKGVVPIWGIQKEEELNQFVELEKAPPRLEELSSLIDRDRKELAGDFCRSCGYCLPCPVGIDIPQAARMSLLLGRAPWEPFTTQEWRDKMEQVDKCLRCNHCSNRCPYGLDTPELIRKNLIFYRNFLKEKGL